MAKIAKNGRFGGVWSEKWTDFYRFWRKTAFEEEFCNILLQKQLEYVKDSFSAKISKSPEKGPAGGHRGLK